MFSVETATYEAKSIANFFIRAAEAHGRKLTPLELMKLVYLTHGWYLGLTGRPLLNEAPEAREIGPVIPTLSDILTIYGTAPVPEAIPGYSEPQDPQIRRFLEDMWNTYGTFDAAALTALTGQPDTPWAKTWVEKGRTYPNGIDIPESSIQEYYAKLNAKLNPNARPPELPANTSPAVATTSG